MGVEDAVYEVEVALKEPTFANPSRVEPAFVKDRVNWEPAAIVME